MKKKLFLLGVGCQKGGTSWLHRQLIKHESIDLGFAKEYHVFDSLYLETCRNFLNKKLDELDWLVKNKKIMSSNQNLLRHIDFYRDTDNYFDYFDCLYNKSSSTYVVGDITPSYSGLPREAFQFIKSQLENRGFSVKVIFLMRDPLERCWSQIRMRKLLIGTNSDKKKMSEQDDLLRLYKTETFQLRTRYEKTITNLEAIFDSDDIFYCLFENLFKIQTIEKIECFLDIAKLDADIQQKVNVSPKNEPHLDEEVSKEIANFYIDTYLFCDEKFGVRKIWSGFKNLQ